MYAGRTFNDLIDTVERVRGLEGVPEVKVLRNTRATEPQVGADEREPSAPALCQFCGKPIPVDHYCCFFQWNTWAANKLANNLTEAHWARFLQKDGPDPEPEEE